MGIPPLLLCKSYLRSAKADLSASLILEEASYGASAARSCPGKEQIALRSQELGGHAQHDLTAFARWDKAFVIKNRVIGQKWAVSRSAQHLWNASFLRLEQSDATSIGAGRVKCFT
jgi:hypothetical protein